MTYCKKCMMMFDDDAKCPLCKSKTLSEITEKDPVFLITKEMIWSDMICDILDENNIPYLKHGNLGTALAITLGFGVEYYKFYVPYGEYEKAVQLMVDIFPSDYSYSDANNENEEDETIDE